MAAPALALPSQSLPASPGTAPAATPGRDLLAAVAAAEPARGYLHLQAPKFARTGSKTTCRIQWTVDGRPVAGIVRVQQRLDGGWQDVADVRLRRGRGTWVAKVKATGVYRVIPVANETYPDAVTPASTKRKIAARKAASKVSAPIVSASSYFTSRGAKVKFTTKWLTGGKRVTGKVRLQVNTSGSAWRTVARGVTAKGKATFSVKVTQTAKYRVVGVSTSSHKGKVKVGAQFGSSPIVLVAAKASGGPPQDSFRITGSGYGHGVGMSQYGAQAMALAGHSARAILTHYYTGTSVAESAVDKTVKVQIGTSSASPVVTFADGGGTLEAGEVGAQVPTATLQTGDKIRLTASAGGAVAAARVEADGSATPLASAASLNFLTDGVMSVTGARGKYKRGSLEVTAIGGKVNIVVRVGLDKAYLYGLAEVPSSWAPGALQAQVIAARN
jgi:hypothetical protein